MRKGNAALSWARRQVDNPVKDFTALCLQFVRMSYDLPAVYPSAASAWSNAKRKHPTTDPNTIPRGVPVFWATPSQWDHIAISLGGGLCLSTDIKRRGRVDVVKIDAVTNGWGARLLGWSEDLNGQTVWTPKPKAPPAPKAEPASRKVVRAREQLRVARRSVAIAERYLDAVPDEQKAASRVGDSLDKLEAAIADRLAALSKAGK